MSQLPEKPSLEYLKKQAKDLLKDFRSNKTEVLGHIQKHLKDFSESSRFLLADAQTVIARDYGFPSWAKLKLHIETLEAKKPKTSARKLFIQDLVKQLLAWSKNY
jgi:hypothetical protein